MLGTARVTTLWSKCLQSTGSPGMSHRLQAVLTPFPRFNLSRSAVGGRKGGFCVLSETDYWKGNLFVLLFLSVLVCLSVRGLRRTRNVPVCVVG